MDDNKYDYPDFVVPELWHVPVNRVASTFQQIRLIQHARHRNSGDMTQLRYTVYDDPVFDELPHRMQRTHLDALVERIRPVVQKDDEAQARLQAGALSPQLRRLVERHPILLAHVVRSRLSMFRRTHLDWWVDMSKKMARAPMKLTSILDLSNVTLRELVNLYAGICRTRGMREPQPWLARHRTPETMMLLNESQQELLKDITKMHVMGRSRSYKVDRLGVDEDIRNKARKYVTSQVRLARDAANDDLAASGLPRFL